MGRPTKFKKGVMSDAERQQRRPIDWLARVRSKRQKKSGNVGSN